MEKNACCADVFRFDEKYDLTDDLVSHFKPSVIFLSKERRAL